MESDGGVMVEWRRMVGVMVEWRRRRRRQLDKPLTMKPMLMVAVTMMTTTTTTTTTRRWRWSRCWWLQWRWWRQRRRHVVSVLSLGGRHKEGLFMSPANFSIPLFRYSVEGVILFRTPRTGGARKKIEKREEIKGKKGIPTTRRFELNPSLRLCLCSTWNG